MKILDRIKRTPSLPTQAPYPGPSSAWDEIALGVAADGQTVTWDVRAVPHALICGPTGSGKSVLQRSILFHCLTHAEDWKIVGIDPKTVEMGWLKKYPNVQEVAQTLEDGVEAVEQAHEEMMRRYEEMADAAVNHFRDLPTPPPALLCVIDETFNFLAFEGTDTDEGRERDALHAKASLLLGEIARLGRGAGIHLALVTQRPDATVIRGDLKANLEFCIAAGKMDTTPSILTLGTDAATHLPKVKGRGVVRRYGDVAEFQAYFADQSWFDERLASQDAQAA